MAALGGALRFNRIADIKKCKFLNCKSKEEIKGFKKNEATIAIFANEGGTHSIFECEFHKSSSFIKNGISSDTISHSNFKNSTCYFDTLHYNSAVSACGLIESSEIKINTESHKPIRSLWGFCEEPEFNED